MHGNTSRVYEFSASDNLVALRTLSLVEGVSTLLERAKLVTQLLKASDPPSVCDSD